MSNTNGQPTDRLAYSLVNGYIRNWLVAGPAEFEVADLTLYDPEALKPAIAQDLHRPDIAVLGTPAEGETLEPAVNPFRGQEHRWQVDYCTDDNFVDRTRFRHTCHYLSTWAYAQLDSPVSGAVRFVITTNGPADVWINGEHVHGHLHFHHQIPKSVPFAASLRRGQNEILVRFDGVAIRECPYVMAIQVQSYDPSRIQVLLPTSLKPITRRRTLERIFEAAYLERDVYHRGDEVVVKWPADFETKSQVAFRLQAGDGRIYAEKVVDIAAGASVSVGPAYQLPGGAYDFVLMPMPDEYYTGGMRVERRLPLQVVNSPYSHESYATTLERRVEALEAAARLEINIFSEIAKMALGRWEKLRPAVIEEMIDTINQRGDCSDFYMVGLLGAMIRYGDLPDFPVDLKVKLADCILNFKYWMDEPGEDAMCYWSENHQILFHACEVLAGQLYPDSNFTNVNEDGAWHREKGERFALSWLKKRASGGFWEWDSNCYFEEDVLALAHLADLAESDEVAEMATIVLDKLFYTLAVNSFDGVFGSTHGRTYTPFIRSGYEEGTSGIARILWGQGCFNERILGSVALACAENYELPPVIAQIALDKPDEVWNRERHGGMLEEWCDLMSRSWEVNKVTYRTPDYMLCSAQDWKPGMLGYQQHIWQATLGVDAPVFVTHPPCTSLDGGHRPNFWHGNVVLPRVAQWKDTLIAIHHLPDDDWTGFTHAYFPEAAFDDVAFSGDWAFARKGSGYIALWSSSGITRVTAGESAYRDLRAYGKQQTWICLMGREALDGSFDGFQSKVLALTVASDGETAQVETLCHGVLAFGWEGPLTLDRAEVPTAGFPHYDSFYCHTPFPASDMIIRHGEEGVRLKFEG